MKKEEKTRKNATKKTAKKKETNKITKKQLEKDIVNSNEEQSKESINLKHKFDKKKIGVYLLILAVFIYVCYTIYLLVKQPTDIFTVEEGKLYQEETNIRICNKKRKSGKRTKL